MGSGVFDIGRRLFRSVTSPFLGSGVTLDILRQTGIWEFICVYNRGYAYPRLLGPLPRVTVDAKVRGLGPTFGLNIYIHN